MCFTIFYLFFKTISRTSILSLVYRFLAMLGLHLETIGLTFGDTVFHTSKKHNEWITLDIQARAAGTHLREGGNWETSGEHLGDLGSQGGPKVI